MTASRFTVPAALAMFACGAFAQQTPAPAAAAAPAAPSKATSLLTDFSIYGVADAGLQYVKPADGAATSGLVSGGKSGSRLGFRGAVDIGQGYAGIFALEAGYTLDTGVSKQGGRLFGRQAFVGLTGPYGTIAAGRIPAFSAGSGNFDLIGDIDPFLTQFGFAGVGATMSSAAGLRLDNSVVWESPNWQGLRAGLGHSFNADGGETAGTGNNMHVTTSGLRYETGAFTGGLTFDMFHDPKGGPSETHLQALAAYDLKVVKLFAGYAREQHLFASDFNATATSDGANAKAYMVGLSAPLGNGTLRASYQRRTQTDGRDLRVPSIGYEYYLSKNKNLQLYAVYSKVGGVNALRKDPDFDHGDLTVGLYFKF
jgi:predicted porin